MATDLGRRSESSFLVEQECTGKIMRSNLFTTSADYFNLLIQIFEYESINCLVGGKLSAALGQR